MIMKVFALKIDNVLSCFSVSYDVKQAIDLYKNFLPVTEEANIRDNFLNAELVEVVEVDVLSGKVYPHDDNSSKVLGTLKDYFDVKDILESEV